MPPALGAPFQGGLSSGGRFFYLFPSKSGKGKKLPLFCGNFFLLFSFPWYPGKEKEKACLGTFPGDFPLLSYFYFLPWNPGKKNNSSEETFSYWEKACLGTLSGDSFRRTLHRVGYSLFQRFFLLFPFPGIQGKGEKALQKGTFFPQTAFFPSPQIGERKKPPEEKKPVWRPPRGASTAWNFFPLPGLRGKKPVWGFFQKDSSRKGSLHEGFPARYTHFPNFYPSDRG